MNKSPDNTKNTKNKPIYSIPAPPSFDFDFIYLLGVISSKWWINHSKKRIRVYLPESKRYIAQALKREWGGTVSAVRRPNHLGVMWQVTSKRSLRKIKEAAKSVEPWLPPEFCQQLMMFTRDCV